jgi:hypothetical protein
MSNKRFSCSVTLFLEFGHFVRFETEVISQSGAVMVGSGSDQEYEQQSKEVHAVPSEKSRLFRGFFFGVDFREVVFLIQS